MQSDTQKQSKVHILTHTRQVLKPLNRQFWATFLRRLGCHMDRLSFEAKRTDTPYALTYATTQMPQASTIQKHWPRHMELDISESSPCTCATSRIPQFRDREAGAANASHALVRTLRTGLQGMNCWNQTVCKAPRSTTASIANDRQWKLRFWLFSLHLAGLFFGGRFCALKLFPFFPPILPMAVFHRP